MSFIISLLVSTIAVLTAAYVTPGAEIANVLTAVVVAVVLGFMNAVVKPILLVLTLPINILTLGLFTVVINLLVLTMVDALVPGFSLGGLFPAIVFAIVLSVLNSFLSNLAT